MAKDETNVSSMTIKEYFAKMKGGAASPPGVGAMEMFWSWIGASIGIMICAYLSSLYMEPHDLTLLIGSLGASAVLVFGAVKSPLAQPRNLVGGHIVSALVGVACQQIFGSVVWLAAAMAVSFAIVAMLAVKTLHPPGGATALIAVIGGTKIHSLGYFYVLVPAGASALILLIVALIINNLAKQRKYPEYWF
jgi:CBS-domain-containing membrane protein